MDWVYASLFSVFCLLSVGLSIIGLPGIWVMIAGALIWQYFDPGTFSWWIIGIVVAMAIVAEVLEVVAGAAGAKKMGSSLRAAVGAILGGIIGAIAGTILIPIPILGTLIGSVLGAGAVATLLEMTVVPGDDRSRREHTRYLFEVGKGASIARLWGALIKIGFACAIALLLTIDGFV